MKEEKHKDKYARLLKAGVVLLALLALTLFYWADKASEEKKNYYEKITGKKLQ